MNIYFCKPELRDMNAQHRSNELTLIFLWKLEKQSCLWQLAAVHNTHNTHNPFDRNHPSHCRVLEWDIESVPTPGELGSRWPYVLTFMWTAARKKRHISPSGINILSQDHHLCHGSSVIFGTHLVIATNLCQDPLSKWSSEILLRVIHFSMSTRPPHAER